MLHFVILCLFIWCSVRDLLITQINLPNKLAKYELVVDCFIYIPANSGWTQVFKFKCVLIIIIMKWYQIIRYQGIIPLRFSFQKTTRFLLVNPTDRVAHTTNPVGQETFDKLFIYQWDKIPSGAAGRVRTCHTSTFSLCPLPSRENPCKFSSKVTYGSPLVNYKQKHLTK